jgi:hypothetical protein
VKQARGERGSSRTAFCLARTSCIASPLHHHALRSLTSA